MKTNPISFLVALALTGPLLAAGEGWTHDYDAAKKQAAEQDKSLLIDFTGSDWCGWCIKLDKEVFQHDAFKEGVKDKFVLVELDFPRDKSKLPEGAEERNKELNEKYGIRGYPTILLTDAEGVPFAKTGYKAGGPENYVTHLDELLAARAGRDEAFAKAEKLEGPAKAKALVEALQAMGLEDKMLESFYGDVIEQIKTSDPEDESGFVKGIEMKAKFDAFQKDLMGFGRKQDHEGALGLVDETLESGGFEGETRQQVAFYRVMILTQLERFDEALTALDDAKAVAPESGFAKRIEGSRTRIIEARDKAAASAEEESPKEDAPKEEAPAEPEG